MRARPFDPRRLDVEAFANEGGHLSGQWPGAALDRLADLQAPPQDMACADIDWQASGERQAVTAGEAEVWLTLSAHTRVWLLCQRCLQPFEQPLRVSTRLRFVHGEAQAEALDAKIEEDVLALTRTLDVQELVEDELLLALPLVPRHEVCPTPIVVAGHDQSEASEQRVNPFALLQTLKAPDDKGL
jgi:uncharacterized protein